MTGFLVAGLFETRVWEEERDEQRLNGVEREVVQRRALKAGVVGLRGTTVVASTRDSGNWEFHRIPWECGELSCGPEVTRELSGGHQGGWCWDASESNQDMDRTLQEGDLAPTKEAGRGGQGRQLKPENTKACFSLRL